MKPDHLRDTLILGFPEYASRARALGDVLEVPVSIAELHRFPDGESLVRIPEEIPERVVLVRSLDRPNDKLVELLLTSATARELGARHITLVAPYLCYMRQDMAFHAGEPVSQRIIGAFLGSLCDALITVDPHLHRIDDLSEAVPVAQAQSLTAAPLLSHFLVGNLDRPLLVGPDEESAQWVATVAATAGLEHIVAYKQRLGDREVVVTLPSRDYQGRDIVIVDDIASTGFTLVEVANELKTAGAAHLYALVTHALFEQGALERIRQAGVREVWTTDSLSHETNSVALLPLLVEALARLLGASSPK